MNNRGEHASPPKQRGAEKGQRRGTLAVFLVGLFFALATGPLTGCVLSIAGPRFGKLIAAVGYGLEHLGVVLVVAAVVRVVVENASDREFFRVVDSKVQDQIEQSIKRVALESLKPFQKSMKELDDELGFTIRRPGLLDTESLEVLKNKVLSPKLIRAEYNLRLTLEPLSESDGLPKDLIKVRLRSTYNVKNITKELERYRVETWVDVMFEPPNIGPHDKGQFTRFACGREDLRSESDLRPFDLLRMEREGKIKRGHGAVRLEHELQGGIPAETTYYVDIESVQVMRMTDIFVWNMGGLTKQFRVSVAFAGGYKSADFEVDARELHHIGHEAFRSTFTEDKGVLSWSVNQVLLPYQGVEVWWSPRVRAHEIDPDRKSVV